MTEADLTAWFVVIVVPILVSVGGLLLKVGADKRQQENRITSVEAKVREHEDDIADLKRIETDLHDYKLLLTRVDERTASQSELLTRLMDRLDRAEEDRRNDR